MVKELEALLLPLAGTIVTSVITYASGLATAYPAYAVALNLAVLGLTYADRWIVAQEDASPVSPASSPAVPPVVASPPNVVAAVQAVQAQVPTFSQGGVQVQYTLQSQLGATEQVGGSSYTVGLQYNGAVSGSGDSVPNGAYYLGDGTFGYNGNYID